MAFGDLASTDLAFAVEWSADPHITEIVASIPNLFFFVVIALANLNPAHGFSIGELFLPVLVTMLFSILPLILAFRIWRKREQQHVSRAEEALGADSP